ncbi:MAG: Bacterial type secretion system protein domain protein [Proteobacteria bacterium]|nr:Bacterial type secretion system protein domain protein [Pseudomonadota bacterium]
MQMIPWLVAGSVGLAVLGISWLVYGYFLGAQRQIQRQRQFHRLDKMLGQGNRPSEMERGSEELPRLERAALFLSGRMAAEGAAERDSEERLLLIRAGFRSIRAVLFFQALRLLLPIAGGVLYAAYALLTGSLDAWLKLLAVCIVLYLAPKYFLTYLGRRRLRELAEELPVFVDFLRMMHSVGISFEQSILLFSEDGRLGLPILSDEFNAVNLAIRSGRPRSEALQQMAKQLDVAELAELVALICQTDRYGAGVQEPLRLFSVRLTEKKRFETQEFVGKMATKMVVVMILFLLPALIIVTAGPGFLSLFKALGNLT